MRIAVNGPHRAVRGIEERLNLANATGQRHLVGEDASPAFMMTSRRAPFHPQDGIPVPGRGASHGGTMAAKVRGIPDNSSVVIPRLICRDAAGEIEFCVGALGAAELGRRPGPDGTVAHALLAIGPAMIMVEAEWPTLPSRAPAPDGTSPVVIFVYVEDVDGTVERAVARGASVLFPAQNQFWGDRIAWIMDPSSHVWTIATRIEETTSAERDDRWSDILEDQRKR
jgi:PhnB protein